MNQLGKTRKFIKKGLILWVIVIGVFLLIRMIINYSEALTKENGTSEILDQLSGIIFIFGICGIPFILFLSVALKLAQKMINKLGKD